MVRYENLKEETEFVEHHYFILTIAIHIMTRYDV